MRDRLIELINNFYDEYFDICPECDDESACIADYLLDNGVIVLPCKIGDTVFEVEKNCLNCPHYTDAGYSDWCECKLDDDKLMFEVDFDGDCVYEIIETKFEYRMIDRVGKTVFLTRDEAEQALAEVANGTR